MKMRCYSLEEIKHKYINTSACLVLFGSGVIGQVVTPELLSKHNLYDKIDCYIDNDSAKWNTTITVKDKQLEVKSPEYLKQCDKKTIIIINISRYAQVLEQLEQMECTKGMTAIIMPMLLIDNANVNIKM